MDINYFRAIHNSIGVNKSADRQAASVKANIEKNFSKTFGTQECKVNDHTQELIVTHVTGDERMKNIISRPSETFYAGDIVDCYGQKWIVLDVDPNKTIYTQGKMKLCNMKIKWISKATHKIIERYGYAENVTKYSSGVRDSNTVQRTEFQIKIRLGLDKETAILKRDDRFLIDLNNNVYDTSIKSGHPDAYILTNRDIFTRGEALGDYTCDCPMNGGVVELTLTESLFNPERDNAELMIADYYTTISNEGRTITSQIIYKGKNVLKCGGNFKTFSPLFYQNGIDVSNSINAIWTVQIKDEFADCIIAESEGNNFKIKITDEKMIGQKIILKLQDEQHISEQLITLEVTGLL